jgi:hypothetical protein
VLQGDAIPPDLREEDGDYGGSRPRGMLPGVLPAADEAFLTAAPSRFVETFEIGLPATAVWAELTREGTLDWCRGLKITWSSPRPFGVGTTRQAQLFGVVLRVQEEYFVWEEGHRMAFFVTSVRPPAYRRSAEDYVVDPLGSDRCRFTWTLTFDLTPLGKLNAPLSALIIKRMFTDTQRHFERLAASR